MYTDHLLYQILKFQGARFRTDEFGGAVMSSLSIKPSPKADRGLHAVLLHGIGSAGAHFIPIIAKLRKRGYTVHIPDLPGHGKSGPFPGQLHGEVLFETLVEWMKEVAPEKFVLLGNSMGGALAWRYAGRHPERVTKLFLLSPAVGFESREVLDEFIKSLEVPSYWAARKFVQRVVGRKSWYWNFMALPIWMNMNRQAVKDLLATTKYENMHLQHRLAEVQVPTLLVWGKADDLLPRSNLDFIKRMVKENVELLEPEYVGHSPQLDAARWLNNVLDRALP